jgi:tripartite-type tricarboxylate transporter receptor subunit TctC
MMKLVGLAFVVLVACWSASCGSVKSAEGSGGAAVVTLVTHSSPGGGSDVFLRTMAPHLSRIMHKTIVVENMQGGSGARAMAALGAAKPDGSMFYATTPTFIYTSLMSKPAATYMDLEPLVNVFYDPEVLFTATDSKFSTLRAVIDHAHAGGGKWGAANPASLERQTMERLKQQAGVNPTIATFEGGGDMMINVLNHTLDMGIGELEEMRGQLDAGKLRLLGVVGDERMMQFPNIATVREQGIDLAVRKFRGLAGPKGTPPNIVAEWEKAVRTLLDDPEYKKLYTDDNLQPGFMPHAEYVKFIDEFGRETADFLKQTGVIK